MNVSKVRKSVLMVLAAALVASSSVSAWPSLTMPSIKMPSLPSVTMPSFESVKSGAATGLSAMKTYAHHVFQPIKAFVKENPKWTAGATAAVAVTLATYFAVKKIVAKRAHAKIEDYTINNNMVNSQDIQESIENSDLDNSTKQ